MHSASPALNGQNLQQPIVLEKHPITTNSERKSTKDEASSVFSVFKKIILETSTTERFALGACTALEALLHLSCKFYGSNRYFSCKNHLHKSDTVLQSAAILIAASLTTYRYFGQSNKKISSQLFKKQIRNSPSKEF